MSNYKDRGIMKWAPFDALTGHGSMIEELIYNINKRQKRELSEDEFQEIDETVKIALEQNKEIQIEYFQDGYSSSTFGKIKKIDKDQRILILSTGEKISFDSVMDIKIVR